MIVVDTNVIAYLLLGGAKTPQARRALQKNPLWVAPLLWRSEFGNVLAAYLRQGVLSLADALDAMGEAEALLRGAEYHVESRRILDLVAGSPCSAYDCEFVALAQALGVPFVTSDAQVLRSFPQTAVPLETFAAKR